LLAFLLFLKQEKSVQIQRINWHIKGLVKIADLAYELDNMSQSANDKFKVLCFWDKHGLQATIDAFGITDELCIIGVQNLKLVAKLL
jgi:hypothetical protein